MEVKSTNIEDVKVIIPRRLGDDRGFFVETFNRQRFAENGIVCDFVQDNHSYSRVAGTVRGLHFQTPPFAQDKLIWCVRGAILDVVVDIRKGSPTFGQHACEELTPENGRQLFVPVGFAHGFCTLKPDTEIAYKVSNRYAPDHDMGIIWNDPDLNISWPIVEQNVRLSNRDMMLPRLSDAPEIF